MDQPIGVIDSGVGGLTVASELMRQLPKEQLIYLGDTFRCPYGSRPREEVIQYTLEMVDFLMKKKIKLLVIACNTATAFTLDLLREKLPIPVIGVIQPGARAAIKSTQNMKIGVIGTEGTIASKAYPDALHSIHSEINVHDLACPRFVPMVEKGILTGEEAYRVVDESLQPLKNEQIIDTLILGCTHYPLLKDTIQSVMGEEVTVISSGEETAREVSAILGYQELLYEGERIPRHAFYTTGSSKIFKQIAKQWLDIPVTTVETAYLTST
ncbi:glutamate racemase [Paraliobacillus sp. JSM ZJ581]|uniref:glutamate racemase n=1 Tax=Paraliobacillus sp. JSM ZJ581 TaxID=3342118 RepID=UPI0035A87386